MGPLIDWGEARTRKVWDVPTSGSEQRSRDIALAPAGRRHFRKSSEVLSSLHQISHELDLANSLKFAYIVTCIRARFVLIFKRHPSYYVLPPFNARGFPQKCALMTFNDCSTRNGA